MALAIHSGSKQKNLMENYSQELTDTLNEAMNVRIELEAIMENAVQIAQTFADQFEDTISRTPEPVSESIEIRASKLSFSPDDMIITSTPNSFAQSLRTEEIIIKASQNEATKMLEESTEELKAEVVIPSVSPEVRPKKTRIYQLAKDLQMTNQALLDVVRNLGIEVHNHMNALDEKQVSMVIKAAKNGYTTEPEKDRADMPAVVGKIEVHPVTWSSFPVAEEAEAKSPEPAITTQEAPQVPQEIPLQGIGFTMEELRNAHPYIAVKTLYDNGYPIRDIAKMLGRGQGEINLILNLSKKKASVI